MNMGFGMQMDDEFNYKLFKKYDYCFRSDITKYFVVLILWELTHKFNKNVINVDIE